jgi:hypothetical protein
MANHIDPYQADYERQQAHARQRESEQRNVRGWFPSSPDTRREILDAIADGNPKYAKPFTVNDVAPYSLIGTQSWSDYGAVVLQMAILDTLLSIEEKLDRLTENSEARTE